jgi:hypothetical protein
VTIVPCRHLLAFVALVALVSSEACDPSEDPSVGQSGPAFLIVGQAAVQPLPPEQGTAFYIQARGGSFVSIVTYGGKHKHADLGRETNVSCSELPGNGEPLYFLVRPEQRECVVEARLYADCDVPPDGGAVLGICGPHDAFVASAVVTVPARGGDPDGGTADANRVADVAAADNDSTNDSAGGSDGVDGDAGADE